VLLATEFARVNQLEKARSLASSAEELMARTGERWFEPEVYRVAACLYCMEPGADCDKAAELFRRALISARELKAPGWELRAVISFSRFLGDRGRRGEACSLLTGVRRNFPSHETSIDLGEADDLLQNWTSAACGDAS
jgi:predicted ATPase